MKATLRGLVIAGLAGSCATVPEGPPARPGDICAIFEERPGWREATLAAAVRWDAPVEVVMAILWRESGFRAEARPPEDYALGFVPVGPISSAYGYAQAIDGTWDWYRRDTGNGGADREDFADAVDFVGWYLARTRAVNGVARDDAFAHYIAYHEGHAGYARGAWRRKTSLLQTAEAVAVRAARYRGQIARGC